MKKKLYLVMSVCTDKTNGSITTEPIFAVDTEEQAIKDCKKLKEKSKNTFNLMNFEYIYKEINFYPTIRR